MSWVAKRVDGVVNAEAYFGQRRLRVVTTRETCDAAVALTVIKELSRTGYDATLDKITPGTD